ncbi:SDR family NAD(P)-dependent oxidoreductase [Nocardia sp. CDC153]|uniref:SDR family NAD(P)-dependent oxidoreductase n=1 Tax=Nocardia sp. CDC153 TaxID=3112167 RepID=UPI002DBAF22D|nr:SDR family NAD(P)-dependent oxidoreductase [Nocardia sp. CDC153]MEC3952779.1 SDR family NAD(P)-dependent oxidoreductase [Nocardia sp. CDC153]
MDLGFYAGQVVVVTGAGAGIGREMAVRLGRAGAKAVLVDVDEGRVGEVAGEIRDASGRALAMVADAADPDRMNEVAGETVREFGGVDVLINNAGRLFYGGVAESDMADFETAMRANFGAAVASTRAFLPHIVKSERGRIANLSSAYGLIGLAGAAPYTAAKFAVRGFTESLRSELRTHPNVAVSCVYPGGVKTGIAWSALAAAGIDARRAAERFDRQVARTQPGRAAEIILNGIARGHSRVLIGADAILADAVARVAGGQYERLLRLVIRG